MSFFPNGYEPPQSGGKYINGKNLKIGANRIRPVSPAVVGFETWKTVEGGKRHPVRRRIGSDGNPFPPLQAHEYDPSDKIKPFVAFAAIDRADGQLKVAHFTQVTIIGNIQALADSDDWGNPADHGTGYDIIVKKSGNGMDTEYSVLPSPKKPLSPAELESIRATPINLDALFASGDPFDAAKSNGHAPAQGNSELTANTTVNEVKAFQTPEGKTIFGVVCANGTTYRTYTKAHADYAHARAVDKAPVKIGYVHEGAKFALVSIGPDLSAVPQAVAEIPEEEIPF